LDYTLFFSRLVSTHLDFPGRMGTTLNVLQAAEMRLDPDRFETG